MASDWQQAAAKKREAISALIPAGWRIPNPPPNEAQVDVTGSYIQQFLSRKEIEITETDAAAIASKTCSGQWKAVEVIKAFCHRAALAHQLVGRANT